MASSRIPTRVARRRLALLWFAGAAVVFLLVVGQSIGGKYGSAVADAWSWFLPTVLPSLSIMVSVLVLDVRRSSRDRNVDRFVFRLTSWLSVSYLVLVLSTLLLQPIAGVEPIELMRRSNLWLGPLQGIVTAALGAFFVKGEEK